MARTPDSLNAWDHRARLRLTALLTRARSLRGLRPRLKDTAPARAWRADVEIVNQPRMRKLNRDYRGKDYATDVLSFWPPAPFRKLGILGELVICLPVLKRQAREQGHSAERELDVLLAHGILHLLGFDHEKSAREAKVMAQWERKLLSRAARAGLIDRAG